MEQTLAKGSWTPKELISGLGMVTNLFCDLRKCTSPNQTSTSSSGTWRPDWIISKACSNSSILHVIPNVTSAAYYKERHPEFHGDLMKTFGTINRPEIWQIFQKAGLPRKVYQGHKPIPQWYIGHASVDSISYDRLPIASEVKQGYEWDPGIPNSLYATLLRDSRKDLEPDAEICSQFFGKPFQLVRASTREGTNNQCPE